MILSPLPWSDTILPSQSERGPEKMFTCIMGRWGQSRTQKRSPRLPPSKETTAMCCLCIYVVDDINIATDIMPVIKKKKFKLHWRIY